MEHPNILVREALMYGDLHLFLRNNLGSRQEILKELDDGILPFLNVEQRKMLVYILTTPLSADDQPFTPEQLFIPDGRHLAEVNESYASWIYLKGLKLDLMCPDGKMIGSKILSTVTTILRNPASYSNAFHDVETEVDKGYNVQQILDILLTAPVYSKAILGLHDYWISKIEFERLSDKYPNLEAVAITVEQALALHSLGEPYISKEFASLSKLAVIILWLEDRRDTCYYLGHSNISGGRTVKETALKLSTDPESFYMTIATYNNRPKYRFGHDEIYPDVNDGLGECNPVSIRRTLAKNCGVFRLERSTYDNYPSFPPGIREHKSLRIMHQELLAAFP